jgi:hypothetical protein
MRHLTLFCAAAMISMASPAIACSCSAPETLKEKRDYARFIATRAEAIVEVEPVAGADLPRQIGETYKIIRVAAGNARPGLIRMARSFGRDHLSGEPWMGGSSCDVFPGQRKQVMLMRTGYAPQAGGPPVPAVTLPGKACGQALPIMDATADLVSRGYVPVFSFGGSCQDWFLGSPGALELVREEGRKLGRVGY